MTASESCCARVSCCQRRAPGGGNDLDAVVARVVKEKLETNEGPRRDRSWKSHVHGVRADALYEALQDAWDELSLTGSLGVAFHPYAASDVGVQRFQVVRHPQRRVVVDFVVGGGLGVVTNCHGSWIVQTPPEFIDGGYYRSWVSALKP